MMEIPTENSKRSSTYDMGRSKFLKKYYDTLVSPSYHVSKKFAK
jgi:hypothetical protein